MYKANIVKAFANSGLNLNIYEVNIVKTFANNGLKFRFRIYFPFVPISTLGKRDLLRCNLSHSTPS